jgi:cytochrome c
MSVPVRRACCIVVAIGALMVGGCGESSSGEGRPVPGGDPRRGELALMEYGCGSCHVIPGVEGAVGKVGPPLTDFAERSYIAGAVPNTSEQLVSWIMDPHGIEPGTLMPNLGVSEAEARDMTAYLYTLGTPPPGLPPHLLSPEWLEKLKR